MSTKDAEDNQGNCHPLFNRPDADIVFVSSDGVKFRLYQKHFASLAEGLAADDFVVSQDEPVALTEPSDTLETLFEFIFPQVFPHLADCSFQTLANVAEAAEKYRVFAAMNICRLRMLEKVEQHPIDVLVYALRHDYPEVANVAAREASCNPLADVITRIPPDYVLRWALYYECHREIFRAARCSIGAPWWCANVRSLTSATQDGLKNLCPTWFSALNLEVTHLEGIQCYKTLIEELGKPPAKDIIMNLDHGERCLCKSTSAEMRQAQDDSAISTIFTSILQGIRSIPDFVPLVPT